jgi:hypothetical protein
LRSPYQGLSEGLSLISGAALVSSSISLVILAAFIAVVSEYAGPSL